jgi:hypothetical protein
VLAIAKYRLDIESGIASVVRDDDGDDYLFVLFQALRFNVLQAHDYQKRAEVLINDIQNEIRRRRTNNRRNTRSNRDNNGGE